MLSDKRSAPITAQSRPHSLLFSTTASSTPNLRHTSDHCSQGRRTGPWQQEQCSCGDFLRELHAQFILDSRQSDTSLISSRCLSHKWSATKFERGRNKTFGGYTAKEKQATWLHLKFSRVSVGSLGSNLTNGSLLTINCIVHWTNAHQHVEEWTWVCVFEEPQ